MWISFLNLIVLSTLIMAKPKHDRVMHGCSVYDYMSPLEQDTVTDIIERICEEENWDFNSIYWDLLIQNEND